MQDAGGELPRSGRCRNTALTCEVDADATAHAFSQAAHIRFADISSASSAIRWNQAVVGEYDPDSDFIPCGPLPVAVPSNPRAIGHYPWRAD